MALHLSTEQDAVALPDMNEWERMVADYGLLQLSPSYHPMGLARPHLPREMLTAARLREVAELANAVYAQSGSARRPHPLPEGEGRGTPGRRARTGGLVVCRQRPGTARGFVFLLIEDETGLTNVIVRPNLYEARRSVVRGAPYLWIEGVVRLDSGSLNLIADRIEPLEVPARALMARAGSFFMPRPSIRHMYAGNPHDPREVATAAAHRELALAGVSPPSHDFH